MAAVTTDVFCSLDMLAEVASEKYRSLSVKISPQENDISSKSNIPPSRKSVSSSEKLTLDQITSLSDKLLIDMFSELSCDEIRKNYTFKCFLIPDKCSQIFKSFGNEARARCRMKMHLHSHIKDLLESNDKTSVFTAEPLHVRRKRLKDLNSKSVLKRKKSKQSVTRSNKDNLGLRAYEMKSSQTKKKSLKHSVQSMNSRSESDSNANFDLKSSPKANKSFYTGHELSFDNGEETNCNERTSDSTSLQSVCEKKIKKKKVLTSSISQYNLNERDTDFDNSCETTVFDFDASYYSPHSYLPSHHDHTYTSLCGKTFVFNSVSKKTNGKVVRTRKKSSHRYIDPALVLPSPPFPFVYIPLLPHVAEIIEVHTTPRVIGYKRAQSASQSILKRKSNDLSSNDKDLHLHLMYDFSRNEEHEQDGESIFSSSYLFDRHPVNKKFTKETSKKTSSSTIIPTFSMDDLETDCPPNLQSVEKELALRYIRTLRTKKKEERGPIVCEICKNKSFTAQATLIYHYRSHAGIKPFSCTVCEATFTRQHSLKYHMLIHYNKSRFVCSDCGRSFRHPSHFKEHLRRHTGETPYECTDCNLRFKTRNTFKRHLKTRHEKILTMGGVHHLPDKDFCKIRSSLREKEAQISVSNTEESDMQWLEIVFPEQDIFC